MNLQSTIKVARIASSERERERGKRDKNKIYILDDHLISLLLNMHKHIKRNMTLKNNGILCFVYTLFFFIISFIFYIKMIFKKKIICKMIIYFLRLGPKAE